jgi:hypothetical protein
VVTPDQIDRLACLAIIDALLEGSARYWEKRARDFLKVGTPKCDTIAQACRNKAALIRMDSAAERNEWTEILAVELGDVA